MEVCMTARSNYGSALYSNCLFSARCTEVRGSRDQGCRGVRTRDYTSSPPQACGMHTVHHKEQTRYPDCNRAPEISVKPILNHVMPLSHT